MISNKNFKLGEFQSSTVPTRLIKSKLLYTTVPKNKDADHGNVCHNKHHINKEQLCER